MVETRSREWKAVRTWKMMHPNGETFPLTVEDFTRRVNSHKGGTYSPEELTPIFKRLERGEIDFSEYEP